MLNARDRVIVALDCDKEDALGLAQSLAPDLVWAKVGMQLFYDAGAEFVRMLKREGLRVFLDLKMHDIPNTVKSAARVLGRLGVDMATVHAGGGPKMIAAAREGFDEGAALSGLASPKLLAVTVLTSIDQDEARAVGIDSDISSHAAMLAKMAYANGADGVVCSAFEAKEMRAMLGPDALVVTPGIRPAGSDVQDQARVATPSSAVLAGASHIVVGRPVTRAACPRESLQAIVDEIGGVL